MKDKLISDKNLRKIIGTTHRTGWAIKDSDGDKVMNMLDCQPYNSRKQGFFHTVAEKFGSAGEKFLGISEKDKAMAIKEAYEKEQLTSQYEARARAEAEKKKEISKAAKDAYWEERKKREVNEAKYRGSVSPIKRYTSTVKEIGGGFAATGRDIYHSMPKGPIDVSRVKIVTPLRIFPESQPQSVYKSLAIHKVKSPESITIYKRKRK